MSRSEKYVFSWLHDGHLMALLAVRGRMNFKDPFEESAESAYGRHSIGSFASVHVAA